MTAETEERKLHVVHGHLPRKIVPYVRVGRERWTTRAKRYRADQDAIEAHVRERFRAAGYKQSGAPYALDVYATFKPAKSTGEIPRNAGDIDNIAKAVSDALQRSGCTPDDCHLEYLSAHKRLGQENGVLWICGWYEEVAR